MALEAKFALLSVMAGHEELARRVGAGGRVPVTIRGFIDDTWGNFDGIDQEFSVEVTSVEEDPA
jgi:hypothetical protein